jgi:hypothetical protein
VLVPGTPGTDAILQWIELEDPQIASQPANAPVPGLMSLPYIPSYATVHARPLMAPDIQPPLAPPSGASGLALVRMALAHPEAAPPASVTMATALSFSGALAGAAIEPLPALDGLREETLGELQPARYLLGVSDRGEVRYVFIQDGSGDKTLDEAAERLLDQVRFRPGRPGVTWGFATYHWGSGAYARASPEPGAAP